MEVHDEKGKQQGLIGEALGLFDLREYHLVFEPSTDSKAMVAWNEDTILIAFRGTASLKAAKLDLEVSLISQTFNLPFVRATKLYNERMC